MPTTQLHPQIPPGQQRVAPGKWPVIGEREPAPSNEPWSLRILGLVQTPIVLSLDELHRLPVTTTTIDIHCVTRWSKLNVEISGVLLADVLKLAQPEPSANFISFIARSTRDHSTSLATEDALELQTLLTTHVDGQPLAAGHGGPLRSVVPGRYFYKSVKWLDRIELLAADRLGFWESESGYHNGADPWQEQRYMAPTIDRRRAAQLIASRDFSNEDLRSINATKRDLEGLLAHRALLRDANFSWAKLAGADFSQANLSNAHFQHADLSQSKLVDADLEGADFSGADLRGADLTGCSLIGASFFREHDGERVEAIIDDSTIMPESILTPLFPAQLEFVKRKLSD